MNKQIILAGADATKPNKPEKPDKTKKPGSGDADSGGFGVESAMSLLNGVTGLVNGYQQLGSIGNTSAQENQIRQLGNLGRYNVNSFGDINAQYGMFDRMQPDLGYDAVRGGSAEERIGNVLGNTATGALTGLEVGGPWGAAVGGAFGLGTGIGGWLLGDYRAEDELKRLRVNRYIAQDEALRNINARMEEFADYNSRNNVPWVGADGGFMERKNTLLSEFTGSISKRQKANDTTHSAGVVREYCKGGVKIRIKR